MSVRVAIVGVGNCASALVQGVGYYRDVDASEIASGLMSADIGGYQVGDIEFVAAFDVAKTKVGRPLSKAIFAEPNNTLKFYDDCHGMPGQSVRVLRGRTLDGLGPSLSKMVTKAPGPSEDVVKALVDSKADVVVNYLPVGSEEATKFYAEAALQAGCAFVNCIPVFIASDATGYWPERFESAGLPIIGDDIKSQVGATIVHRMLTHLFEMRGVELERTYQLNFGGNTDFFNMLDRHRLESKKISKTQSVQSQLKTELPEKDIHVGPSDHVPWLEDRKWCHIKMEGAAFGGAPLEIDLKLQVWDSPNSAGIVIDAVRYAKLALDKGLAGPLIAPSAYLMKSPPEQFTDEQAWQMAKHWAEAV